MFGNGECVNRHFQTAAHQIENVIAITKTGDVRRWIFPPALLEEFMSAVVRRAERRLP